MNIFRSAILVALAALQAFGQTAPLHAIVSNGMKAVILELQPKAEKAVGPLILEFGTTTRLQQKIEAGAPFDLAILTADAISNLAKENKLSAATRVNLSKSGIGVAVRAGAAKPDISTPEALKKTLLDAPSLTWAGDGASRPHLDAMLDELQIAARVKPKVVLTQGSGPAMQRVATGQTAMVLTLISELKTVPAIEVVGPLPEQLQSYVEFAAGISSQSDKAQGAKTLLGLLTGPNAAAIYRAKGMEPWAQAGKAKK